MKLPRDYLFGFLVAILGIVLAWLLFIASPEDSGNETEIGITESTESDESTKQITAILYYISENGLALAAVEREVTHSDQVDAQARHILEEQLSLAPDPYISAVPEGTKLKAVYVTNKGEAFVDLSTEATANHPGGSLNELFTIYALVNAITSNLPSITAVQILVGGKEVDTLAGHVDLRHPLQRNLSLVQ